jgi:hypothetical protein
MKTRSDVPSAAQRGQMIANLVAAGVNGTRLAAIITGGKTRGTLWTELRQYAKSRTKTQL